MTTTVATKGAVPVTLLELERDRHYTVAWPGGYFYSRLAGIDWSGVVEQLTFDNGVTMVKPFTDVLFFRDAE